MKTFTKALLGGAAMMLAATATVQAEPEAAAEANDNTLQTEVMDALGERILSDMNNLIDDMRTQSQSDLSGVTVSEAGDVSVEPTGYMEFKVVFPEVRVSAGSGNLKQDIVLNQSEYKLTFENNGEALDALFTGANIAVNMKTVDSVSFDLNFLGDSEGLELAGQCASIENQMVLGSNYGWDNPYSSSDGSGHSLESRGVDCAIDGDITDNSDGAVLGTVTSDFGFNSEFKINANGNYDSSSRGTLNNFVLELVVNAAGEDGTITIDEIYAQAGYTDQPPQANNGSATFDVNSLPNSIETAFWIKGLNITDNSLGETLGPVKLAGGTFSLSGLHGNELGVDIGVRYDVSDLVLPDSLNGESIDSVPEASSCDFEFGNIPLQDMADIFGQMGADPADMDPMMGIFAMNYLMSNSNVTLDFNCASETAGEYKAELQGSHTIQAGVPVGSGSIEVQGSDKLLEDLSGLLGAQEAGMLGMMFEQFAVPNDDGTGKVVNYEVDSAGNLTVNDQPMGPAFRP